VVITVLMKENISDNRQASIHIDCGLMGCGVV
jgi:hypothetical protein